MPKMVQTEYGEWYVPYRPSALRNIMGQIWFPYLAFFIVFAIFAIMASITEKVYKRRDLIQSREHLLQVLPVLGNRNAAVKVLEFTDYACAFCSEDHFQLQKTLKPYIDRGEVALFTLNVQKLGARSSMGTHHEYCIQQHDPAHLGLFADGVFRHNGGLLEEEVYRKIYQNTGGTRLKQVDACLNTSEALRHANAQKSYVEKLGVQSIQISYGSVAIQDHAIRDLHQLERWVKETVAQNGKLPAEFKREAQRLY
ncbi:DsbA family protein [Deinococcus cellulosilyticus]|uniref:Thioredoxin-like fold domain-containing protein n=1 Tax=Deinococcus cellulosilyticus (strain DSM 18568 / NBRC 106333 / KACC 11606 / 5516J-15) TaxID=1223518 RepID=A0A511N2H3_DEIC1|nr:thioredoxin domain-containing protein [Deinococcus cellulosilyticus]GEM47032.1 hypothetical protein DC3_26670 [Deinococcus cellulosilyticus NBRC 106333 = KACC 11606]